MSTTPFKGTGGAIFDQAQIGATRKRIGHENLDVFERLRRFALLVL
ncbi:MAG: hypothetical protein JO166_19275 [Deltaproteobacteria bacterium]|nr:hypothetical protein [Deltaproteobacteria bacterium]